jgi:integrase
MSKIEKRVIGGKARWLARYRDPAGLQRAKTFGKRIDAERFLITIDSSKLTGTYIDPKQASRTFRDVAEEHWAAHAHNLAEDTTRPRKRSSLDLHILPVLGEHRVNAIKPSTMASAVATWSKTLAPGTVGHVLRQVRQILDAAVADGIVPTNAAKAVTPPTPPRRRNVHLSDEDIRTVILAAPDRYRALVIALIGLGLRISEAAGLLVTDIDFLRKSVQIRQQRRPGGDLGVLKTSFSARDIPADDQVLEALAEQIRRWPREDGLVFGSTTDRPLSKAIGGHVFDEIERTTRDGLVEVVEVAGAASYWSWRGQRFESKSSADQAWAKSGLAVSPHSCRHYFGSSLISRGVSVVAVSRWLGHSSPEITWRVYSYLMANDEQVGRDAMRSALAAVLGADVYSLGTEKAADAV